MTQMVNTDFTQTFQIEGMDVRGRLVRLGPELDKIVDAHGYPAAVAEMLSETLTLGAVLASALKYDGLFTLQVQSDGPISLLVADITSDGHMRGYARYDEDRLNEALKLDTAAVPRLLGAGHLAFTVDQGADMERYQGIAALEGATLAECAQHYFRNSEQLETAIYITANVTDDSAKAGALMVQRMPQQTVTDEAEAEDCWRRAVAILASLTAAELLDEGLDHDTLLYRLYHEDGVRAYEPSPLLSKCRCSREKVVTTLKSFPRDEITGDDGYARIECEFCKTNYDLSPSDLDALYPPIN
ncbi:MAG: Hsp33 family molecular chaperone HslO [Sphingomonadales bacterium]|nr:Hsp33 family molecular chaperone HslO [Sphingomonadales bacterium]